MRNPDLKKTNRLGLLLLIVGLVLALILMSLPLYRFNAAVYIKKSPNTFVGDEKYLAVKEEVETVAESYRAQGFDVQLDEDVLTRVNSKGETTSLITFTINESFSKNVFSFLGSGLPSESILILILAMMALAPLCALLGCRGEMDLPQRYLPRRSALLRSLACAALLVAVLAVPVFVLMNNYAFSRQISLYNAGLIEEGKEALFAKMDRLLFALLRALLYFFVVLVCVITLYPYYVMTITAFRSNAETLDMYFLHLFPTKWIWSNLTDIIQRGVPRYLLNSLLVAGGATALAMLCGVPAAYAMARMRFVGKKAFLGFVIMSQMFSPVVLLIGISHLMITLRLNDSVLGLMFINAAFNQAFAIWLLRGTFVSISPEMEQAALIDGCGTVKALTKVLIPMAAPGIVTALIFVFINAWNEYTISTVLISTASNRPITVGITQFSSFNMIEWQYLFAASLLATIPVVILFMSIEKHLTAGLTSGGVKG